MLLKKVIPLTIAALFVLPTFANAGVIDNKSVLLDEDGAELLEGWLGQGDLDWTQVWYGEAGATSQSWHDAVDDVDPTVSIYKMSFQGNDYIVGGYTDISWEPDVNYVDGYKIGQSNSFIFNLQTEKKFDHSRKGEINSSKRNFATFGQGYDLYGGRDVLGENYGSNYVSSYKEYYFSDSDSNGITGKSFRNSGQNFVVMALETFTFNVAGTQTIVNDVSVSCGFGLMSLGLLGAGAVSSRKQKV